MRRKPGCAKGPLPQGREHEVLRAHLLGPSPRRDRRAPAAHRRRVRPREHPALQLRRHHRVSSATAPWTAASSIASAPSQLDRTICSAAGAPPRRASMATKLGIRAEDFRSPASSSSGPPTSTATTSISGPSSKRPVATARSSSSSTPTAPAPPRSPTAHRTSVPAPTSLLPSA